MYGSVGKEDKPPLESTAQEVFGHQPESFPIICEKEGCGAKATVKVIVRKAGKVEEHDACGAHQFEWHEDPAPPHSEDGEHKPNQSQN